jgi:hypothetical protein
MTQPQQRRFAGDRYGALRKKYPSRGALEMSFIIFWLSPRLNLLVVVRFIVKFCHFDHFGFAQGRLREKSCTAVK